MNARTILRSMLMLAAVSCVVRPGTAKSQDAMLASAPAEVEEVPAFKSGSTATLLSAAGTVVPAALGLVLLTTSETGGSNPDFGALLFSAGIYFGPATGYWYGGASGPGWKGVGIRVGISLATTLGMLAICSGGGCDIFSADDGAMTAATVVGIAGLGAIAASIIHDIGGVNGHVKRHNAEVATRQSRPRLSVAPVVTPQGGGTIGVAATMSF